MRMFLKYIVLKGKLRPINIFKSLFEQKSILIRQYQTRSGQEHSTNRSFYREEAEAKQRNYLISHGLSVCIILKSLVGCL